MKLKEKKCSGTKKE